LRYNATSASYALSSSFANNAASASYALSSSQAANAISALNGFPFSGSAVVTGSVNVLPNANSVAFGLTVPLVNAAPLYAVEYAAGASTRTNLATNITHAFTGSSNSSYVFGRPVDFKTNTTFTGSVNVTGSVTATSFTGSLAGTASIALNALTASFLSGNVETATNGFPFSGSAVITGSLTITNDIDGVLLDFKQPSHTTESIYSIRMGNQADVTESLAIGGNLLLSGSFNNTYRIVIPTTIDNATLTGSLFGTASWAENVVNAPVFNTGSLLTTASVSLNTITFTKGDASTFAITVDTGSGGGSGFATTGSNVFSGSQTFNTASLYLNASGSSPLFSNFTQSVSGTGAYGNILMFQTSINSGSVILSGSRNVGTISPPTNAGSLTLRGGGNLNGNFGLFATSYTTASAPIVLNNSFINGAIQNSIPNTSSIVTLGQNFIGGTIIVTGSATSNVNITSNNIDAAIITNDFTGSGASQNVSVLANLIKGGISQPNFAQIKFAATQSNGNSRVFQNNIMFGPLNIVSLEASGAVSTTSNLFNTAIIGSNLVVSGTMANNSTSASMFVGQFNEQTATYAPADPSTVKFAVGTGTTNAARRTSFQVFNNGDVVVGAIGGGIQGRGHSVFTASAATIVNATVNAGTQVGIYNGSFVSNGGSIAGGNAAITTAIIAGEVNTISQGRSSATVATSYGVINTTATADTNNIIAGTFDSQISGSTSRYTGIYSSTGSFINESRHSAIIGANNVRLNNTTGSVALGRDTAYTGSANYTLYTQNVDISGSVKVNGNVQYNYGSYYNTSSISLTANTSQSLGLTSVAQQTGFALSGSSNEQIKATNAGTYNLQFSAQVEQGANSANIYIWFKKNGTNIADSATKLSLGSNSSTVAAWNFIETLAANDTLEIVAQSDANNTSLGYAAASGNIPAIPSVIATITQVK